jgi:hypothetical protein
MFTLKPSAVTLWVACSAFGTFMSYIIGYTHALNCASAYMPKGIFEGGKGFSLNSPLLFGLPMAAAAALAAVILLCISIFGDKQRILSQSHCLALVFLAPGFGVFLLFRWLSA